MSLRGSFAAFETKFPMFADVTFKMAGMSWTITFSASNTSEACRPAAPTVVAAAMSPFKAISGPSTRTPVSGSMRVRTKGRRQIIEYTQNVTFRPDISFTASKRPVPFGPNER